jgi:hypothetical protein
MSRTHFDPLLGLRPTKQVSPQPVLFVPDPPALRAQPFPGSHRRQRPNDRCLLPLPACFDAQDTEATLVVVESSALDQTVISSVAGLRSGIAASGEELPRDFKLSRRLDHDSTKFSKITIYLMQTPIART